MIGVSYLSLQKQKFRVIAIIELKGRYGFPVVTEKFLALRARRPWLPQGS